MTLDPRWRPRSYPEMLQDLIALHARLHQFASTDANNMTLILWPAVKVAEDQLDKIARNAAGRMIGGRHG